MFARRKVGVASAAVLAAVMASYVAAASPAVCNMRLAIELTPDVPDPLDSGFLSSLLSNQVSYRLSLLGRQPGSVIVTELEGPGPEYRCRNVVEAMRKDGRVLSIHLDLDTAMRARSRDVPRGTLDLRPPDLRSLGLRSPQQAGTDADPDQAEAVSVAAAPLSAVAMPDTQPQPTGIASLVWAARHPTQAWRVFLPIPSDQRETHAPEPVSAATG
jgi:hypothetical protein